MFYGVGTILGLGIYVLLGEVAGAAGAYAPIAFLLASLVAMLSGLSYGELAARIPKSAGEVNYVDEAFGQRWLSMLTGWLIVLSAIVSTATVVNGYVGYVHEFVYIPDWLVILGITTLLGGIATWGISESAWTITLITVIEVVGIVFVIAVGADSLAELPHRWPELIPSASAADAYAISAGAVLAFFTFVGFEDLVNVAEEAQDPERHMLPAVVLSLAVLSVAYVLVSLIAVLALDAEALRGSKAPLADILRHKGEAYPLVISGISLVAIINGVLVQIVMSARVLYGMARKGMAPALFARIHPTTRTPVWSTVIAVGAILVTALTFDLNWLANATSTILLLVFTLVNASLWALKRRGPPPANTPSLPRFVPIAGVFANLAVLGFQAMRWVT